MAVQTAFQADAFQNNAFQIASTTGAPSAYRRYQQQLGATTQAAIFADHTMDLLGDDEDDDDNLLLL